MTAPDTPPSDRRLSRRSGSLPASAVDSVHLDDNPMSGPSKDRLHNDEAGWFTFLLTMAVADAHALRDAQSRVAQAAIDETNEQREWFLVPLPCIQKAMDLITSNAIERCSYDRGSASILDRTTLKPA
jgi:hypothetical protein